MPKIAVIGAGSWGTAAASLAATNADVVLWARRAEVADAINRDRANPSYLRGYQLPPRLSATDDLEQAVDKADVVAIAVPSHGFRDIFEHISTKITTRMPIVSLTKGIEQDTLATMTAVISDVSQGHDHSQVGVLTGPNLAAEIAARQPTAAVIAMPDQKTAAEIQSIFMSPLFRVYTNDDVIGCELGGALKNVMAIATGVSDGLGFGDNTRATLITRALHELTRLGVRLGGKPATFAGLAGMGDLIATCVSDKSRNHRVGFGLASGKSLDQIAADMNMVAEGVKTTRAVVDLAAKFDIEMPIAAQVARVLYDGMEPREAMLSLMTREAKPE